MRIIAAFTLFLALDAHAFLGSEMPPLIQLVAGQLKELESLSATVGLAQDQVKLLKDLNRGVENTISQIRAIEAIIERTKDLNPTQARSLSDLNDLLGRAKATKEDIEVLMHTRLGLASRAIEQSALQSDTSYRMGTEMVSTGAVLAQESTSASPGRASQISASAESAQMLAKGVELQNGAHIISLLAMQLELERGRQDQITQEESARRAFYRRTLLSGVAGVRR